jgi:hypothetical protein
MKRRDFLKLLGLAPIVPSILRKEKSQEFQLRFMPNQAQKDISDGLIKAWWFDECGKGQPCEWLKIDSGQLIVKPIPMDDFYNMTQEEKWKRTTIYGEWKSYENGYRISYEI